MIEKLFLIATFTSASEKMLVDEHLEELALLVKTYGGEAVYKASCPLKRVDASTYLGSGKIQELAHLAAELNVDTILFDEDITPAQQRNLEKIFGKPVIDRTELILEVFAMRAHSKEAHLQVELARVKYQAPRLKRMWTHLSRQTATGGAGGYLRGVGETQLEIDKRLLDKRIHHLEQELEAVKKIRDTQRKSRLKGNIPVFAIIGYTNAGKSTLLNALTDAGVLVEDKLFATLDTTTRKFSLPDHQEILLIDTVGFIRKLPHQLVEAFKSTLEEALHADFLIHLIDASHPNVMEQVKASNAVLEELGANKKTIIHVFNKIDKLERRTQINRLKLICPLNCAISALKHEGFNELFERITDAIRTLRQRVTLRIAQKDYNLVSHLKRVGHLIEETYEDNDVILDIELPKNEVIKLDLLHNPKNGG